MKSPLDDLMLLWLFSRVSYIYVQNEPKSVFLQQGPHTLFNELARQAKVSRSGAGELRTAQSQTLPKIKEKSLCFVTALHAANVHVRAAVQAPTFHPFNLKLGFTCTAPDVSSVLPENKQVAAAHTEGKITQKFRDYTWFILWSLSKNVSGMCVYLGLGPL